MELKVKYNTIDEFTVNKNINKILEEKIEEMNKLILTNELEIYVRVLLNRINKAIEYIKDNACYDESINKCVDDLMYCNCDELLEILKGE